MMTIILTGAVQRAKGVLAARAMEGQKAQIAH